MKRCINCKTENRDEAIFCQHCRRPLPKTPSPPRLPLVWLALVMFMVGFGSYFFFTRSPSAQTATPTSNQIPITGPMPTRTRDPITLSACVDYETKIRRGPGKDYEMIAGLPPGTCMSILGRNEDGSWLYVISEDDYMGWVAETTLADVGDIHRLAIRDDWIRVNPARATLTSEEIAHGAKVYLTSIAATNNPDSPIRQSKEACFESADQVGDNISCRMEKAYCDYFPDLEGSPTICIDRPAPDHTFALVTFDRDWSEYDGKCLIVTGYLEIYRGVLQIEAFRQDQVAPCT